MREHERFGFSEDTWSEWIEFNRKYDHVFNGKDFICPLSGKVTDQCFSDHDRPGMRNACRYCHEDQRTTAQRLHDLNEKRGG